jgi:hypothetical protein
MCCRHAEGGKEGQHEEEEREVEIVENEMPYGAALLFCC